MRVQTGTGWVWKSLQGPKWGGASRCWVLDAVAGEFVGDGVVLAVDVTKNPMAA